MVFRSERDRLRDEIKVLTKELRETRNGLDEVYDSIDDLVGETNDFDVFVFALRTASPEKTTVANSADDVFDTLQECIQIIRYD